MRIGKKVYVVIFKGDKKSFLAIMIDGKLLVARFLASSNNWINTVAATQSRIAIPQYRTVLLTFEWLRNIRWCLMPSNTLPIYNMLTQEEFFSPRSQAW